MFKMYILFFCITMFVCIVNANIKTRDEDLSLPYPSKMGKAADNHNNHETDPGERLILTPLINAGQIDKARQLSRVTNLTDIESYSGFFTTNAKYNSNMFFWFFPAVVNKETAPVVVWLQGGPGGSSLFGLFVELGAFIIDANNNIHPRKMSWSMTHSVIFFDNPVGTGAYIITGVDVNTKETKDPHVQNAGFSFTEDDAGYARFENDVADGLYSALTQFFTVFPEYQSRDFYTTGESYAGKYVPAISYRIHQENQKSPKVKINFKGMAIGNGISDPVNMLGFGGYLYGLGLIDEHQRMYFEEQQNQIKTLIDEQKWTEGFEIFQQLMFESAKYPSYFENATGFTFHYNILMSSEPPQQKYFSKFIQLDYVRRAIHVGNGSFSDLGNKVMDCMAGDFLQSVSPWVSELLDAPQKYKVLIYSGQLDIIVPHTATDSFLRHLKWHGAENFTKAERKQWKVGKSIAGYVKVTDNLTYLLVRNAGHMVPYDQPEWSFDMINRFTKGKPFAAI